MVEGETLGHHRVPDEVGDGSQVMGLSVQMAIMTMGVLGFVEPGLGVEVFSL